MSSLLRLAPLPPQEPRPQTTTGPAKAGPVINGYVSDFVSRALDWWWRTGTNPGDLFVASFDRLVSHAGDAWSWVGSIKKHLEDQLGILVKGIVDLWRDAIGTVFRKLFLAVYDLGKGIFEVLAPIGQSLSLTLSSVVSWAWDAFDKTLMSVEQLFTVLKTLAGSLLSIGRVVDSVIFAVEARLAGSFELARTKVNEAIFWLNHFAHPLGVMREEPWFWSLKAFLTDALALVLEFYGLEFDPAAFAGTVSRFPVRVLSELVSRFRSGAEGTNPALLAELARFHASGGSAT